MWLVDRAQMRNIDQYMIGQAGVVGLALMEQAGAAVARACVKYARSCGMNDRLCVHVVAGKGHNGADGVVAARHLMAQGHRVRVWLSSAPKHWSAAMTEQVQAYKVLGGELAGSKDSLTQADIIVDALLGTGSRLPLADSLRPYVKAINRSGRPVIAVDIPSGLDADTGGADKDAIAAVVTVTMGFAKVGMFQFPGRELVGQLTLESLSMPAKLAPKMEAFAAVHSDAEWEEWRLPRDANGHKGSFGKVGVVAGSPGMYGAARLALLAAYRAGAGLVEYFCGADYPAALLAALPVEALVHMHDGQHGAWDEATLIALSQWAASLQSVVLGPGMGAGILALARENSAGMNRFAAIPVPLVLDADFLNALALLPDRGKSWWAKRTHPTVITPHPKELARLLGGDTVTVQSNRVTLARAYAMANQVVVTLKGAGTVTAFPDGHVVINTSGHHGLATGGTGDVLAGVIGGLLAAGYSAERAAPLGVYMHGKAADLALAAGQSAESLLAGDLFYWLGRVFTPHP